MKRLLTLAALTAALGLPPAAAWEREAFKALKEIKDMATEQAKQEKAEKEQAAKEQAEREEQERAAREEAAKEQTATEQTEQEKAEKEQTAKERAEWEAQPGLSEKQKREQQLERERQERIKAWREQVDRKNAEIERERQKERERAARVRAEFEEQRKREQAAREAAELAEQERERERKRQREREEAEQLCNKNKDLADDFSIVEYAQGKGVLTPDHVKEVREFLKTCNLDIQTAAGDPSCPHYLYAMTMQEQKTISDRHKAIEAEGIYDQMKKAKRYGLLSPSEEMEMGKMKKDLREKRKAKGASQRKFEILYRQADEAGCLDEQSD